jgi:hypothetical protein
MSKLHTKVPAGAVIKVNDVEFTIDRGTTLTFSMQLERLEVNGKVVVGKEKGANS